MCAAPAVGSLRKRISALLAALLQPEPERSRQLYEVMDLAHCGLVGAQAELARIAPVLRRLAHRIERWEELGVLRRDARDAIRPLSFSVLGIPEPARVRLMQCQQEHAFFSADLRREVCGGAPGVAADSGTGNAASSAEEARPTGSDPPFAPLSAAEMAAFVRVSDGECEAHERASALRGQLADARLFGFVLKAFAWCGVAVPLAESFRAQLASFSAALDACPAPRRTEWCRAESTSFGLLQHAAVIVEEMPRFVMPVDLVAYFRRHAAVVLAIGSATFLLFGLLLLCAATMAAFFYLMALRGSAEPLIGLGGLFSAAAFNWTVGVEVSEILAGFTGVVVISVALCPLIGDACWRSLRSLLLAPERHRSIVTQGAPNLVAGSRVRVPPAHLQWRHRMRPVEHADGGLKDFDEARLPPPRTLAAAVRKLSIVWLLCLVAYFWLSGEVMVALSSGAAARQGHSSICGRHLITMAGREIVVGRDGSADMPGVWALAPEDIAMVRLVPAGDCPPSGALQETPAPKSRAPPVNLRYEFNIDARSISESGHGARAANPIETRDAGEPRLAQLEMAMGRNEAGIAEVRRRYEQLAIRFAAESEGIAALRDALQSASAKASEMNGTLREAVAAQQDRVFLEACLMERLLKPADGSTDAERTATRNWVVGTFANECREALGAIFRARHCRLEAAGKPTQGASTGDPLESAPQHESNCN